MGLGLGFSSPAEDGCMLWWRLCQSNSCLVLEGKLAGHILIGDCQPCQSDHCDTVTAYVHLSMAQARAGGVPCWGRGQGAKPGVRVDLQAVVFHFFSPSPLWPSCWWSFRGFPQPVYVHLCSGLYAYLLGRFCLMDPLTLQGRGSPGTPSVLTLSLLCRGYVGQAGTLLPVGTCSCRGLALRALLLCPYGYSMALNSHLVCLDAIREASSSQC